MHHACRPFIALVAVLTLGAPVGAFAQPTTSAAAAPKLTISKDEYNANKAQIKAEYKAAKLRCDGLKGNDEDVCEAEAEGQRDVALAQLDYRLSGKKHDARKAANMKIEAAYKVAKEKCDNASGNAKDVCLADAKVAHEKDRTAAAAAR